MSLNNLCYYILLAFSFINIILPFEMKVFNKTVSPDYVNAIFLLLYFAVVAVKKSQRDMFIKSFKDFANSLTGIVITIIVIFMLVSVTYAKERGMALNETLRFIINMFLFFTARYHINENSRMKNIINTICAAIVLVGIYGIVQYFTAIGLKPEFTNLNTVHGNRITSTYPHPNSYGAFLVLFLFPVFMLVVNTKELKAKIWYGVVGVILVVNIIFTQSRNAWLAVAIGFFILTIYYSKKLLIPFVLVVLVLAQIPMVSNRIKAFTDWDQNSSRIKHWKTAVLMIKDHPLIGVGNGNYVSYYDDYIKQHPELDYNNESRFTSHNSYLKEVSELGIVGCIPFFALLVITLINISKYIKRNKEGYMKAFYIGFFASAASFLCMNFVDNILFIPKLVVFFWIFAGYSESFVTSVE
jgi:Lipid A core - O-antigen ligase and related enzymes